MPIPALQSFRTRPYIAPGMAFPALLVNGNHHMYTVANSTFTCSVAPQLGTAFHRLTCALPAGDTIFLPYIDDHITSVRLPYPAPGAVNFFFTASLDGCKIFVDSIFGSNDLIVYHANTTMHPPGAFAPVNFQAAGATLLLDNSLITARLDYAPAMLNGVAELAKPAYFQSARNAEIRKANQGRVGLPVVGGAPAAMSGCVVFGIPGHGKWDLYYQTWGDVNYQRPDIPTARALFTGHWKYLHKRRVDGGLDHTAGMDTVRVLDFDQFY